MSYVEQPRNLAGPECIVVTDATGHFRKLSEIRRDVVEHAYRASGFNVSAAARRLHIGRSSLYRLMAD